MNRLYNWLWGYNDIPLNTAEPAKTLDNAAVIRAAGMVPVYIITNISEVEIKEYSVAPDARAGYLLATIKKKNNVKALNQRSWHLHQGNKLIMLNALISNLDTSKAGYVFITLSS